MYFVPTYYKEPKMHKVDHQCFVEDGEFYLLTGGYALKDLPDIPIVCAPLLNTSTHKLAVETNPRWFLRVRHKGHWRTKTRPKVRIYPEGGGSCPAISFHLPAQPRFETVDNVMDALRRAQFTLNLHDIRPAVHKRAEDLTQASEAAYKKGYADGKMEGTWEGYHNSPIQDPFVVLADWNQRTEAELKARRPKLRLPTATPTNIVSIQDFLRERGVTMEVGEVSETGTVRQTA